MNRLVTGELEINKWYVVPLIEAVNERKYWDTACCVYMFKKDDNILYIGSTQHTFAHRTIQHLVNRRSKIGCCLVNELRLTPEFSIEWKNMWFLVDYEIAKRWCVALNFPNKQRHRELETKMIKHYRPILNVRDNR